MPLGIRAFSTVLPPQLIKAAATSDIDTDIA
jgi:hypothetical protein